MQFSRGERGSSFSSPHSSWVYWRGKGVWESISWVEVAVPAQAVLVTWLCPSGVYRAGEIQILQLSGGKFSCVFRLDYCDWFRKEPALWFNKNSLSKWIQCRKANSCLWEDCRYLLLSPLEIFITPGLIPSMCCEPRSPWQGCTEELSFPCWINTHSPLTNIELLHLLSGWYLFQF